MQDTLKLLSDKPREKGKTAEPEKNSKEASTPTEKSRSTRSTRSHAGCSSSSPSTPSSTRKTRKVGRRVLNVIHERGFWWSASPSNSISSLCRPSVLKRPQKVLTISVLEATKSRTMRAKATKSRLHESAGIEEIKIRGNPRPIRIRTENTMIRRSGHPRPLLPRRELRRVRTRSHPPRRITHPIRRENQFHGDSEAEIRRATLIMMPKGLLIEIGTRSLLILAHLTRRR